MSNIQELDIAPLKKKRKRRAVAKKIFLSSSRAFFFTLWRIFLEKKYFFVAFVFLTSLIFALQSIYNYAQKILPTKIVISTGNKEADTKIYSQIKLILQSAVQKNESRSEFIDKLNKKINTIDYIDEYWIRLGFDKILEIKASLQHPLLLLETKNNETYLVSNKFKIIAKNPPLKNYPQLIKLSLPQTKINWVPKAKRSGETIEKEGGLNQINIQWLAQKTQIISLNHLLEKERFKVEKIAWDPEHGFSLLIHAFEGSKTIKINLGEENIPQKVERLKFILPDLEAKKLLPTFLDLDYPDKASFKTNHAVEP